MKVVYNVQMAIHQAVKNLGIKASRKMIESEIRDLYEDAKEQGLECKPIESMGFAVDRVVKLLQNRENKVGSYGVIR